MGKNIVPYAALLVVAIIRRMSDPGTRRTQDPIQDTVVICVMHVWITLFRETKGDEDIRDGCRDDCL